MSNPGTLAEKQSEITTDPVCGMSVVPGETKLVSLYNGHSYWFCAEHCREAFEKNPEKYLGRKTAKPKSWLGRYLARMAKVNQKEFGSGGPSCCQ